MKDGRLEQSIGGSQWVNARLSLTPVKIKALRQSKKVEEKKYYLILKEGVRNFLGMDSLFCYLNYHVRSGSLIIHSNNEIEKKYQTKFTEKEINGIRLPEGLSMDMFERVEVEE